MRLPRYVAQLIGGKKHGKRCNLCRRSEATKGLAIDKTFVDVLARLATRLGQGGDALV